MDGGEGPATKPTFKETSEECVELLRRWLSGDDAALDAWLGGCGPSVEQNLLALLDPNDTELQGKDRELDTPRRRFEILEGTSQLTP